MYRHSTKLGETTHARAGMVVHDPQRGRRAIAVTASLNEATDSSERLHPWPRDTVRRKRKPRVDSEQRPRQERAENNSEHAAVEAVRSQKTRGAFHKLGPEGGDDQ